MWVAPIGWIGRRRRVSWLTTEVAHSCGSAPDSHRTSPIPAVGRWASGWIDRNIRVANDLCWLRTVRSKGATGQCGPTAAHLDPAMHLRPSALHSVTWLLWAVAA